MAQANAASVLRTQADGRRSHMSDLLWVAKVLPLSLSVGRVRPKVLSPIRGSWHRLAGYTEQQTDTSVWWRGGAHFNGKSSCCAIFFCFFFSVEELIAKSYPPNLHLYYGRGFVAMLLNNAVRLLGGHWNSTGVRWLQIRINNNKGRSGR